jgi:hypothetical protein
MSRTTGTSSGTPSRTADLSRGIRQTDSSSTGPGTEEGSVPQVVSEARTATRRLSVPSSISGCFFDVSYCTCERH